ncbi:MAG: GNAT family N-acetyltransferase [Alphaproteobacteria bacterium]|nr:GNAT family N-acetyltransferase [Alphaproteobacteria bacterium]
MRLEMRITELRADDLKLVLRLARTIWPAAYANVLTPAQIENLLDRIYSDENLRTEFAAGHRFWAAWQDTEPVGYASGYREGGIVWLKKLYVLPDRQGHGIGRALMESVIAGFAPVLDLRLFVNGNNIAAQRFYERTGFACIGEQAVRMGDYTFTDKIYRRISR